MRLTHISPGTAHLEMPIRPDILNGFATCHGGMITTLAGSAFGFACDSYNERTVASDLSVDSVASAFEADFADSESQQSLPARPHWCVHRVGV